jgi:hypothetical protein
MSGHKKTWGQRLRDGKAHEVKPAPINIAGMKAGQIMLVPTALMVDNFIRTLPKGRSLNARQLRDAMAAAHGAEVTCPITTGFHLRTVAEAAWEALAAGTPTHRVTPVWRVLPPDSLTLKKLSFDSAFIRRQREIEGLDVAPAEGAVPAVARRAAKRS